jgi:hypothetical protein
MFQSVWIGGERRKGISDQGAVSKKEASEGGYGRGRDESEKEARAG